MAIILVTTTIRTIKTYFAGSFVNLHNNLLRLLNFGSENFFSQKSLINTKFGQTSLFNKAHPLPYPKQCLFDGMVQQINPS